MQKSFWIIFLIFGFGFIIYRLAPSFDFKLMALYFGIPLILLVAFFYFQFHEPVRSNAFKRLFVIIFICIFSGVSGWAILENANELPNWEINLSSQSVQGSYFSLQPYYIGIFYLIVAVLFLLALVGQALRISKQIYEDPWLVINPIYLFKKNSASEGSLSKEELRSKDIANMHISPIVLIIFLAVLLSLPWAWAFLKDYFD